jgi:hypothetical protein
LSDLNIVARIDISAGDDAIDLRNDVAIPKVELGQNEVALGRFDFSVGLFDGGCIRDQPSEGAVNIALRIQLVELELCRRLGDEVDQAAW